jgi:hypothetical protein
VRPVGTDVWSCRWRSPWHEFYERGLRRDVGSRGVDTKDGGCQGGGRSMTSSSRSPANSSASQTILENGPPRDSWGVESAGIRYGIREGVHPPKTPSREAQLPCLQGCLILPTAAVHGQGF